MEEEWREVVGYEGRYEVSNCGRVKSLPRYVSNHTGKLLVKEKILSTHISNKGYANVSLSKDSICKEKKVHRLVAEAFIDNPNKKMQVNHIDGNKKNNNVSNLEWCNNSENQIHAYKHGLNYVTGKAGKPKKEVLQIEIHSHNVVAEYKSITDAARTLGLQSSSNISQCCRGKKKTVGGYAWKYKKITEGGKNGSNINV